MLFRYNYRKSIELDQHQQTDQRLRNHEGGGLRDGDLLRGDRARASALDQPIKIAVDEIVPGAACAAHCKCADEEQDNMPGVRKSTLFHAGKTKGPPARHQQQPGTDRQVKTSESQVRTADRRRENIDPISGRIGDASGAVAHRLPSGLPVRVSKVPRPVLILLESGIGLVSASLRLGPCGRGGAAAAWHTLVRISAILASATLICSAICGGMPHQVPFSLANLSILDCAVTSAPNNWHASFGGALRSFAALIAAAFFSASSRSLKNSWTQGGICCCDGCCCCCCGGGCALAAMATSGTMQRLNIARRNLMKPTPPGKAIIPLWKELITTRMRREGGSWGWLATGLAKPCSSA